MHIAICDDNIADRKQFERLIKRESDIRAARSGILFADSFGNTQALLHNPRQYDVFYIDMCKTPGVEVPKLIDDLRSQGVVAPIVLCSSEINYRLLSLPDDILFLDKPIRIEELRESLDHVQALLEEAPALIEIREEFDTEYVNAAQILYAAAKGNLVQITLTDGRILECRSSIDSLMYQWEPFETFTSPSPVSIINIAHIKDFGLLKIIMSDGTQFHASPLLISQLKKLVTQ